MQRTDPAPHRVPLVGLERLEPRRMLSWTVMAYLDGDNSLAWTIERNFNDLADVGSSADVRIVAEIDGVIGSGVRRGEVLSTSIPDDSWGVDPGQSNMGDPATLHSFLEWAVTNYPADHYALILADHGGGLDGICYDVHAGDDVITLPELSTALVGMPKYDMIGMDACIMGMVEVAYQLAGEADYFVASEAPEPTFGWPYTEAFAGLAASPSMSPETLVQQIVSAYGDQYGPEGEETMAAIDVAQLGGASSGLAGSLENFATLMTTWSTDADWQAVMDARDASQSYEPYSYRDLGDFMTRVENASVAPAIASAAARVHAALDAAVVACYAGEDIVGEGLSIFLPAPGDLSPAAPYCLSNQFAADTHWDDFIAAAGAPRTTNNAPLAEAGGPYTVLEGGSVMLNASASSDPDPGEPANTLTYLWDLDGDGVFGETGSQATRGDEVGMTPTLSVAGLHGTAATVSLRVLDHLEAVGVDTAAIQITLVPPQVGAIAGPDAVVPFRPVVYTVDFHNPFATDTHTARVNWGDGSATEAAGVNELGGAGTITTPAHAYANVGNYTVTITVRDDDGSEATAQRNVSVTRIAVGSDPQQAGAQALFVGGTSSSDYVFVDQRMSGQIYVFACPSIVTGLYSPSANGHIYVYAGPGNDTVVLSPLVTRDAVVDGGAGHDVILGGRGNNLFIGGAGNDVLAGCLGNNVLIGGDGNDVLSGGLGRSLLVGGTGQDTLVAGCGGSILIGGATAYDANATALLAILAEWSQPIPIDARLAHLSSGGGLNGTNLLNKGTTVFDDGVQDFLFGSIGDDWFVPWASDIALGKSTRDR